MSSRQPPTPLLGTDRLRLDPLVVDDAAAMADVLADPELYRFTGGEAPSVADLTARYEAQTAGSGRADEHWHNWIVRMALSGEPVGFVQATVDGEVGELAWTIGRRWQGRGFASEAAVALVDWARADGLGRLIAHIAPGHIASERVAGAAGLAATGVFDDDGEQLWERVL